MWKVAKQGVLSLISAVVVYSGLSFNVASAEFNHSIMYIPQDNRPISYQQTVDNIKALGYEVLTPPEELLGNRVNPGGHPQELTAWAIKNAPQADVAVISSDALLYGSLVASRNHQSGAAETLARVGNIASIRQANQHMKLYVFGSIMRTPQSSQASGGTDAAIYAKYGTDIARYTALTDKASQVKLTRKEKRELRDYEAKIPQAALQHWLKRREGNLLANKALIDLTQNGTLDYLALGADDNAKYSQTAMERRELDEYAHELSVLQYQSVAGIDEIGYVLLMRGVNQLKGDIPFVNVVYATGKGINTIPAYSNEKIGNSVATHIQMAGGIQVKRDNHADEVLMVNTKYNGTTGAANNPDNNYVIGKHTAAFITKVNDLVNRGKNVSIGDIAYSNGADNALMSGLLNAQLLNQLGGYSGWNTPTNSTGYAIAMGMGTRYTDQVNRLKMLEIRYLDDWLYQANVRQSVAAQLGSMPGQGNYGNLDGKLIPAEQLATQQIRAMVRQFGLNNYAGQQAVADVAVSFPWNRMFEAGFTIPYKQ